MSPAATRCSRWMPKPACPIPISARAAWWTALAGLSALGSGFGYFVGFAPPSWLRWAWQVPELRAFLAGTARLPHLPDTRAVILALERGVADALGAPHAAISLWDEAAQALLLSPQARHLDAPDSHTLDRYIATRQDVRPNTLRNLGQSRRYLVDFFGEEDTRSMLVRHVSQRFTKIINVPNMKDHGAAGVTAVSGGPL